MGTTGFGASVAFGAGLLTGLAVSPLVLVYSLARGIRAFHPYGTVCRAEIVPLDGEIGPRLAGPAIVRLSGTFERENSPAADIVALSIRTQPAGASPGDLRAGDQDLILASFESFRTVKAEMKEVDVGDYLGNRYSSVALWRVGGLGVGRVRATPPPAADPGRAADRVGRLDADIAAGRATFTLLADVGAGAPAPVAELRLIERLPSDGRALRISVLRAGRGLRPTGFFNGVRVIVYPVGQVARRVRGG